MVWHEVNIIDYRRRPSFEGPYFIWVPASFDILRSKEFASSGKTSREVYVCVYPEEQAKKTYPYTTKNPFGISHVDEPSEVFGKLIHFRYIQLKKGGAAFRSMLEPNYRIRPAKRQA